MISSGSTTTTSAITRITKMFFLIVLNHAIFNIVKEVHIIWVLQLSIKLTFLIISGMQFMGIVERQ